jgi:hypothetical protein
MERAANRESDLDRAFVQCRVIETGLHHLAATLSDVDDATLRGDLAIYARRFDAYVRRLSEVRERAGATETPS